MDEKFYCINCKKELKDHEKYILVRTYTTDYDVFEPEIIHLSCITKEVKKG